MECARVLIVEDDMVVLIHLQSIVAGLGHQVIGTATNPRDALALAEQTPPDLVLMDIRLEGDEDGIGAAEDLCDRFGCAVIFITAYSDQETVSRSSSVGAVGYIIKPFSAAEVGAAISTGLSSHGILRRTRERERRLSSALGGMSEGVLVVDDDELIRFANPGASNLTGWPTLELYDQNVFEVIRVEAENDVVELRKAMKDALASSVERRFTRLGILARDGKERIVDVRIMPVQEEADHPTCLVLALRELIPAGITLSARDLDGRECRNRGTRLLVYSHDTLGLGHLRRCLNLLRALASSSTDISSLLVTGSPVAHRYELPVGTDYLKLPSVRKVAADEYSPRFLSMSDDGIHALRSNLLLRTIRDYDPEVLLVDHSPSGMNGELLPALEWLQQTGRCKCILGLRDVIDDPEAVIRDWERGGIYDLLRDAYDQVVIYGSPEVYDTVQEYRFPPEIAQKTRFIHQVTDGTTCSDRDGAEEERDPRLVVLTIGGGDGGVDTVVKPFLDMMALFGDRLNIRAEVILGPLVGQENVEDLRLRAKGLPVVLRTFVQDPKEYYQRAHLVIATAGYNTTAELLSHAARAILVPRVLHRSEQLIRARRMAELGLMACLHPEEVSPSRLFEEVRRVRSVSPAPLAQGRRDSVVPLDGAACFATFFTELVAQLPKK